MDKPGFPRQHRRVSLPSQSPSNASTWRTGLWTLLIVGVLAGVVWAVFPDTYHWHWSALLNYRALFLKGWLLMRQGKGEEAETALRASIDWARQQQAKSWELRSSTTLAQLLVERGQRDAAREVLAPIYDWFSEGFDTHDLKAAHKLLESLR